MGKDKHSFKLKKHKGGKQNANSTKSSSPEKPGRLQKIGTSVKNIFSRKKSNKITPSANAETKSSDTATGKDKSDAKTPEDANGKPDSTAAAANGKPDAKTPEAAKDKLDSTVVAAKGKPNIKEKAANGKPDIKNSAANSSTSGPTTPPAATSSNPITMTDDIIVSNPEAPGGKGMLMDVFSNIFIVLAAIGLVMLGALLVFSIADIIRYSTKWGVQTILTYFFSKDIFNKETIEMQLLEYHKNDSKEEPYTIFLQQYLAKGMFILGASAVVIGVIQICIYALLLLYFKLRENPNHGERLTFNGKAALVIFLTVLCGGLLYVTYKYWFQNTLQKKLVNSYNTVTDITDKIYNNMTSNSKFITNLVNSSEKQEGIQENITIMNGITGDGKIDELAKMIYTISVYNYFKNIIPGKDEENYNNVIKPMFIQKEASTLFPSDYMYYLQNMFIPNDYPNIINHIFGQDKAIKNKEEDIQLLKKLNEIFTNVNTTSKHIYRLPKNVPMMFWYFLVNTIIIIALIGTITIVYGNTFKKVYNDFLIKPCNSISQYLLKKDICFPFTNIPIEEKKEERCETQPPKIIKINSQRDSPPSSVKPLPTTPNNSTPSKKEEAALEKGADTAKGKDQGSTKQLDKTESKERKEPNSKLSTTNIEEATAAKGEAEAAAPPAAQAEAVAKAAEASPPEAPEAPAAAPLVTGQNTYINSPDNAAEKRRKAVEKNPNGGGKKNKKSKRKHK